MSLLSETWAYLSDAGNWVGSGGMLELGWQQLLLTATALAIAMLVGLPVALWLGHHGRGGFVVINISGVAQSFRAQILTASVLCVLLAVLLDALLVLLQRSLTSWTRA